MSEDEKLCESCGKRPATCHITEIVKGKPHQQHLCDECYAQAEGGSPAPLAAFAELVAAMVPELKELATRTCPACGLDYLEFRQNLRLGCPHDYEVFDKPLTELAERIHGASRHEGKVPVGADHGRAVRRRLRALRRRQRQAIAEENYELAAELRDRIRKLQANGPDDA